MDQAFMYGFVFFRHYQVVGAEPIDQRWNLVASLVPKGIWFKCNYRNCPFISHWWASASYCGGSTVS